MSPLIKVQNNIRLSSSLNVALMLLLFFCSLLLSINTDAATRSLNSVAVVVNDEAILESEIQEAMKTIRVSYQYQRQAIPSAKIVREKAVDQKILESLQRQEAKRLGIVIDDARLNQALSQIAEGNHQNISQLRSLVVASGLNWDKYKEQIRTQVATSEARNANMRRRIQILPQEIESERNNLSSGKSNSTTVTYTLSQIILSTQYSSEAAQMQKAKTIMAKLRSGASFSVEAITNSDAENAVNGGRMGTSSLEQMPSYLRAKVSGKSAGLLEPFVTQQGVHIVKIERVNTNKPKYSEVQEYRARHILLKTTPIFTDEKAKKKLTEYRQMIVSGQAKFSDLADQYSADVNSAVQGGDLGWSTGDKFVPEFKAQFKKLKLNQVSQPFKSSYGWHILELTDRRNADKRNDALSNQAYQNIFRQRFSYEIEAWLQELKSSAYIKVIK